MEKVFRQKEEIVKSITDFLKLRVKKKKEVIKETY